MILDFFESCMLDPGRGYELAVGRYQVTGELGTATEVTFCDTQGDPPVETALLYWSTRAARPVKNPAVVTITQAFLRGDVNGDQTVDVSDPICLLGCLFGPTSDPAADNYCREQVAACMDAGDVNDDGAVDLGDPIYLLNRLFANGKPVPAPGTACGADPTPDELDCSGPPGCP